MTGGSLFLQDQVGDPPVRIILPGVDDSPGAPGNPRPGETDDFVPKPGSPRYLLPYSDPDFRRGKEGTHLRGVDPVIPRHLADHFFIQSDKLLSAHKKLRCFQHLISFLLFLFRKFCRSAIENLHKLFSGDGLMIVQIFGQLVKLADVVLQNLVGFLMLPAHQIHNLLVDEGLGLKGTGQGAVCRPDTGCASAPWLPYQSSSLIP